jgi:predicted site-specific integrase-resolvase
MSNQIKYYTVKEAADIAKREYRTIWNYLKSGILKGKKFAGKWLISEEELRKALGE